MRCVNWKHRCGRPTSAVSVWSNARRGSATNEAGLPIRRGRHLLLTTGTVSRRAPDRRLLLDLTPKPKHHPVDPKGSGHLTAFKLERGAGFVSEVAGLIRSAD
jgi:hypothetical protein